MNINKTRANLLCTIEKLNAWREALVIKHKEDSDEFIMLTEVMSQCLHCLARVTSVCEKGYDYYFAHKNDIAELDRQAKETMERVGLLQPA